MNTAQQSCKHSFRDGSEEQERKSVKAIYYLFRVFKVWIKVLITFRKKIVYIGGTDNVNLGDNAQRLLIRKWCRDNFPSYRYIEVSIGETACLGAVLSHICLMAILSSVLFFILRIKQRKGDVFVSGSGYGLVDHASTWVAYARLSMACKKTPILIMPQTINFMNPWIGETAARAFNGHGRILMLCRDFVSLEKAERLFPKCHPIAYPDIVTSMIGTRRYDKKRDGVLFCVRNDGEAFYSHEAVKTLQDRFSCRVEEKDTTLDVSHSQMQVNREKYIDDFLEYVAGFKVVITDRYHGTIFSLVANTPVVVISSTDHKLSSGVKWFPAEFSNYIQFAETLDKAYEVASRYLHEDMADNVLPVYFIEQYWNKLKEKAEGILS